MTIIAVSHLYLLYDDDTMMLFCYIKKKNESRNFDKEKKFLVHPNIYSGLIVKSKSKRMSSIKECIPICCYSKLCL